MAAAMSAPLGARDVPMASPSSGNLWQQLLRDSSVRSKLPVVNFLVVGDHESGKTALLSRLDERSEASTNSNSNSNNSSSAVKDKEDGSLSGGATSSSSSSSADAASGNGASPFTTNSALLSYSTMHILDPKSKQSGHADASDDVIAHVNTWVLNELALAALVQSAVKPHAIPHTVVAVVLDLSRPWTIKSALEQWTSALEGQLLQQINQLAPEQRGQLYHSVKQHILAYEDPSIDHSVPKSMELSNKKEFLEDGALARNLGVPLMLIVAKSDLRPDNSVKMDYIEFVLRQFAIKYGAAIFYTSAKTGTNIDLLRKYLLHRAYPRQFKFDSPPQLIERHAIFVPAGYDSFSLVNQSLVGSQPKWPADKSFDKIVPPPLDEHDDHLSSTGAGTTAASSAASAAPSPGVAATSSDIKLDLHERWLEKLEKAAGAGLEDLQKQSVEASKKAEAAAAARRSAAERRKRDEKDVNSTHLANFFNNLLSRPEKSKSSRSLDVKKKEKSDQNVKSLAEQELQNLTKRSNTNGPPS